MQVQFALAGGAWARWNFMTATIVFAASALVKTGVTGVIEHQRKK
jgi:hypothetical protein